MTKEEIGKILKNAREQAGLTQAQVAQRLGKRHQVIGNWETGYAQPDANTLFVLCDMYGISLDDTFIGNRHMKVSTSEMNHIKKYRALDDHGKYVVDMLLNAEHERCLAQDEGDEEPANVVPLRHYYSPSAAGSPLYAESGYEMIEYNASDVPGGADFAVDISGNSMEPTLPNGCTVFVHQTQIVNDGDLVIAWVDGEGTVCKRALMDGDRITELHSDNPAVPSITGPALANLRIYGRVLGHII